MSDKDFYKNAMDKIALHTMEEIDTKQIRQKKKICMRGIEKWQQRLL